MKLLNRVGHTIGTTGTGTVTLGSALGAIAPNVCSYQTASSAGAVDQDELPYLILDSNGNWEEGYGTYTASGTTLTRNVVYSNNSNNAINLSGNAQIFFGAIAAAGGDVLGGWPNPMRGFDAPVNLQLNASVGSNLLSVAVKGNNGNDPSPTNPVYIAFRDPTAANGDPVWRRVTASLSINTNATGATLASVNNTAFRFWVCAFDNAGTVVLALINCSNGSQVLPLNEHLVASTTGISGSATSLGTFYTPNGTSLSSKAFRILGYVEYNSTGLTTAGTYATAPNFVQLFGPGIKKPGDVIQLAYNSSNTATSTTSSTFQTTGLSVTMSPSSAANPIRIDWQGTAQTNSGSASGCFVQMFRGSTGLAASLTCDVNSAVALNGGVGGNLLDLPNTTSATIYAAKVKNADNVTTVLFPSGTNAGSTMLVQELMG